MNNNSSRALLLTTLAGVQDARLDGDFIVGHWKPKDQSGYITNRHTKRSSPSVVEDFVNVDSASPQEILRFTVKYGPLSPYPESADLDFQQSLKDWREFQGWLRWLWSQGRNFGSGSGMTEGDTVYFNASGRVSRIDLFSLRRFLEFEIISRPYHLRRVCARPGCGTYFIAKRKDTRLCDTPLCTELVQKQYKTDWWKDHGEEWRERRTKKRKSSRRA